jgi:hypothetical protein
MVSHSSVSVGLASQLCHNAMNTQNCKGSPLADIERWGLPRPQRIGAPTGIMGLFVPVHILHDGVISQFDKSGLNEYGQRRAPAIRNKFSDGLLHYPKVMGTAIPESCVSSVCRFGGPTGRVFMRVGCSTGSQ